MKTLQERTALFAIFSAAYATKYVELLLFAENENLTTEELRDAARREALHLGAKQLEQLEYSEAAIQSAQQFFLEKHEFAQEIYDSELAQPTLDDLDEDDE